MIARLLRRMRRDDRGSLAMAMVIAIVAAGLGAVLLPMTITQINATSFDHSRVLELDAAEAGVDVALGLVRSSVSTSGAGIVSALPCTTTSPVTGTVAGSTGGLSYSVTLGYYTQDPIGHTAAWQHVYAAGNGGMGMICASGSGTFFPPTHEQVPSYVLVTSTGRDSRGSRTLKNTYVVQTSNANVAGGTVYLFPSGSTNYCMDAGSARPVAGVAVKLQQCVTPATQQQAWSYNSDLSVQLVSSVTSAYPNGLCLSTPTALSPQVAGTAISLLPCSPIGGAPWYQKWSVDNNAHLEGAKPDSSDINGLCINAASQGAGVALKLATCAGGVTDAKQTWVPSPDVGAGMAGSPNNQLVNFQQFGRCMDVTNTNVNQGFLIAYTCKQDPNPSLVLWNQKFTPNAYGELVTNNGSPYCLRSPLAPFVSLIGPYVTVTACPGSPTGAVTWTKFGATDVSGNALPPLQKYTLQDSSGLCLSLTTSTSDAYNGQYSKLIMATCDGSSLQKWDALPDVQSPRLTNLSEVGGD
jgi:Ricin-type beta-trefoil lectin domain